MALLTPFAHGGNAAALARRLGVPLSDILDASASINPFGPPPEVLQAAQAALGEIQHYPEVDAATLRTALADFHGLPVDHLLPGSGSTELIYLLPRVFRPRRALLVAPCFSEYERALLQAGCEVDLVLLPPGDQFDAQRVFAALQEQTELVLVASPGNPSGALIPPRQLLQLASGLREQALLVVDEAFIDFAPEASVLPQVAEHGNLYVLRSLTKFYAIPGLRAGYLAGPPAGIARLAAAREPWALSTPAQAAALSCLQAAGFRRATLERLPPLRDELAAGLTDLGLEVFPAVANYLLSRLPDGAPDAAQLAERSAKRGVLIRDCGNFAGLDHRYLRLAVRSREENRRLLTVLAEAIHQGGEAS